VFFSFPYKLLNQYFSTMAVTTVLIASFAANLIGFGEANAYLRSGPGGTGRISADTVKSNLLTEIEGTLGSASPRGRIARIEASLSSMFAALPKNEYGNLGHTTVRYALHRLFVQQHGWYVKGLEPAGDSWNTTSPASILKDRVSSEVINLMESRLDGHGFGLHDTAVLAATLEHIVHDEALGRLGKAYEMNNIAQNDRLDGAQSDAILDTYMKLYILPEDLVGVTSDADMLESYPGWTETKEFVHDVQREVSRTDHGSKPSFMLMENVVSEVAERYGHFQDAECRQMKNHLVSLGDHGVGRVQLADFYRPAVDDNHFAFQETVEYLRELGALDETDSESPSVIIPNYVNAPCNCIASSSFYSVCCLDECEQLMGHLEQNIKASEAPVATVADLVSNLPSSTVQAPRSLSPSLLARLEEVAAPHAGVVQLHGRMFGQWMHHAYPRECPFPHVAGSTAPRTPDEWLESTGGESVASPEEMRSFVEKAAKSPSEVHPGKELNHWESHEELLVPFARSTSTKGSFADTARKFVFFAILVAMAVSSLGAGGKAMAAISTTGPNKAIFGKGKEDLVLPVFGAAPQQNDLRRRGR